MTSSMLEDVPVETEKFVEHIFTLSALLQGATEQDKVYFNSEASTAAAKSFVESPLPGSLFVLKQGNGWAVSGALKEADSPESVIVIIKEKYVISNKKSIDSQVQVVNLPTTGSFYDSLKSLVDFGVGSYFDALTVDNKADSVTTTKKKIKELVLSLQHMEQAIKSPELYLTLNPIIKDAINKGCTISNYTDFIPEETLNDSNFLNSAQTVVNGWVKSIQSVTKMTRDVTDGSASDEINFWISMEATLLNIQEQLQQPGIQLTLEVLKYAKRYHTTVSFMSDVGIKDALATATDYNKLMKDFPLDELLSATTFDKVEDGISMIVLHLKKFKLTSYPVSRALSLFEAISSDLDHKLKSLLGDLMAQSFDDFQKTVSQLNIIFDSWDRSTKEFTNTARELMRKRNEKFIFVKINSKTTLLKERIQELALFRMNHKQLETTLENTSVSQKELDYSYDAVRHVEVFDHDKEWNNAKKIYDRRIEEIENEVIEDLKSNLESSRSIDQTFKIFQKYQYLIQRPRIRIAIQEYQSKLLNIVKSEINDLQKNFVNKSNNDDVISKLRDFPPVSYTIQWAEQTEAKLDFLIERLELVLGPEWNQYAEGQKIYSETKVFKTKLDTSHIFQQWLETVSNIKVEGNIFKLTKENEIKLEINFNNSLLTLFKEVRALSLQKFQIPHNVVVNSRLVKKLYPHAVILEECVSTLAEMLESVEGLNDLKILVYFEKQEIYTLIDSCFQIQWDSLAKAQDINNQDHFDSDDLKSLSQLENNIFSLSEKLETLTRYRTKFTALLQNLRECQYDFSSFQETIYSLQQLVNQLIIEGFLNIDKFIVRLNHHLMSILFERFDQEQFQSPNTQHELQIQASISIEPPLQFHKYRSFGFFQEMIQVVLNQNLIVESPLYKPGSVTLKDLTDDVNPIYSKFELLLEKLSENFTEASKFVDSWFQYDTLWSFQSDDVYNDLSLETWMDLLEEIKKARQTFDTADSTKVIGSITIHYSDAKEKIAMKFTTWKREVFQRFSVFLHEQMSTINSQLNQSKKLLENLTLNLASIESTVELISALQSSKMLVSEVGSKLMSLKVAQSTLLKQRFKFQQDFIYYEQIEGDYLDLQQLVEKRFQSVESHRDVIIKSLETESLRADQQIKEIIVKWSTMKPSPNDSPEKAIEIISNIEQIMLAQQHKKQLFLQAADMLVSPITIVSDLTGILEELNDLKSVWVSIQTLWKVLSDLKSQLWNTVKPNVLRTQLEDLLLSTKSMPTKIRQHQPFQLFLKTITDLTNSQKLFVSLKEDCVKERHLSVLFKSLGKKYKSNITVGDIWDLELTLNEPLIKKIINQAVSEKVLDDTLNSIKETWNTEAYDYFTFNGNMLVKNFPGLIEEVSNNLLSLSSMRNSIHFKVFEQDILQWETNLSKLHQILDLWVTVQRQFMDLDGIFNLKSEVRKLLPQESLKFHGISNEFLSLLKKIYKNNLVIEILTIADVFEVISRISESLTKLTKALGEFLEKQRELYPRLFFIGNDDLLEIIANATDIPKIGKHFKKMYAGVSSVTYDSSTSLITGVNSEQGESINLLNPVSTAKYSRIDQWLTQLDYEIKCTLSKLLEKSLQEFRANGIEKWLGRYPVQVTLLTIQINWTQEVERALVDGQLHEKLEQWKGWLELLASPTFSNINGLQCYIIELVHQESIISELVLKKVNSADSFWWKSNQTFYYNENFDDLTRRLIVKQNDKEFVYGFEYLGVMDRLVHTPLLKRCFLSMTNALDQGLGGAPFGPAGTGKTETIKALGQNLGKLVLVFNCDDSFDFQAMGRLLKGICEVGAWGCFDEFNRLNKNILSAVSSQLVQIENGLRHKSSNITLLGKKTNLELDTGIFVTMNPTYSGRATLPQNLKKLFRNFSMDRADNLVICEVFLIAQGFVNSKVLSVKVVGLFNELLTVASKQKHYDFGLRALKSTLEVSGKINALNAEKSLELETSAIVTGIDEMILPRLVTDDLTSFQNIKKKYFGEIKATMVHSKLISELQLIAQQQGLAANELWTLKVFQLFKIQETKQGIIIVGKSESGKTKLWKSLLNLFARIDEVDPTFYVIEPKVLTKSELFGYLDPITRDWTDGIFTSIIRSVIEDLRGEHKKRTWIIFDGDVDPVWVESLNSVLDDNKILTLPNGERLEIPSNIRLIFEVDTLDHATLATVSRCGMLWIEDNMLSVADVFNYEIHMLETAPIQDLDGEDFDSILQWQQSYAEIVKSWFSSDLLNQFVNFSTKLTHVMEYDNKVAIRRLFVTIKSQLRQLYVRSYNDISEISEQYIVRSFVLSLTWAFCGDSIQREREQFTQFLLSIDIFKHHFPKTTEFLNILDFDVDSNGQWFPLSAGLETPNLDPHSIVNPNTVIPTIDTLRHENLVYSLLSQNQSLIMCGPPGSGKTMTLYAALSRLSDVDVCNLNFSKETEPLTLLRAIEQLCDYKRSAFGTVLKPKSAGKRVVFFCDEINLPKADAFGTQRVISFMRQLVEQKGFWRPSDKQWISTEDIQFVGACNPPTDAGRVKLTSRFLSHVFLVMVDYPGLVSLEQIYGTFSNALLKLVPSLLGYHKEITKSMIEVYNKSQLKFTQDEQAHYVYSPRELTRWVRGLYSALRDSPELSLYSFIRLYTHEAIRLFCDRLVTSEARQWTLDLIKQVTTSNFPTLDIDSIMKGPILYSDWLSLSYESVDQSELVNFITERLKVFSEEVLDVELVLHDEAVDHILRIDRVLRQPQGHLILVGPSSSGKTSLTKFVAWINGLKTHQLTVNKNYTLADFDSTLRNLMKKASLQNEKICFIVDESTILDGAFLERMNSLLANSQIQEIFDPEEYKLLLGACKEKLQSQGSLLDTEEELYDWFTQQVANNLHVVFTINDPNDPNSPQIITSPALFNRCVLNWMGDWSTKSVIQVSEKLLLSVPIDKSDYVPPQEPISNLSIDLKTYRDAVINTILHIYTGSHQRTASPGNLINFVKCFIEILSTKERELQADQRHLNNGLDTLRETVIKVKQLQQDLSIKEQALKSKQQEAKLMLNKILTDQNEAERKQEASVQIQGALEEQEKEINAQRELVMKDLALAEPAILEARRGVKNIKKQHLTELRSMSTPPQMVQLTLESVCVLLGYEFSTWRDVQLIIRKDDFITNIVNFDNERQLTVDLRDYMQQQYLSKPEYTFAAADRASKACGPLLQWVEAQIQYSLVIDKVAPLREDVVMLENESLQTKARLLAIDDMINELQESIESYKDEYSSLIRETENIKIEMESINKNVSRALQLVENLTGERTRWAQSIKEYDQHYQLLIGDAILTSAMLTFGGTLDQKGRALFLKGCKDFLNKVSIASSTNFRLIDFLNCSIKSLEWQSQGLPNDDLFFENIAMIENVNKTPYIIDPSGKIVTFLENHIKPKKLIITSFLDSGFVKNLENALRFGGCLLIQDAESYDPIISRLLSEDFQRIGGRTLVNIGGNDIDCSPDFKMFLHSKDQNTVIAPFVSTRTCIIDFTVTESGLETQTLNLTLSKKKPEVERQRQELIKLNGDYKIRLKQLEVDLLKRLSESEGNLLDNDELISTLESLKTESAEISQKMEETVSFMENVEQTLTIYHPLARNSALLFSLLSKFTKYNKFYQFSLNSYLSYFVSVLDNNNTKDSLKAVDGLISELFQEIFAIISLGMLQNDRVVLAVSMALLYYKEKDSVSFVTFSSYLLKCIGEGGSSEKAGLLKQAFDSIDVPLDETLLVKALSTSSEQDVKQVLDKLGSVLPELQPLFESVLKDDSNGISLGFNNFAKFLFTGFGPYSSKYEFEDVLSNTVSQPIVLVCAPGFDATNQLRSIAEAKKVELVTLAMGSKEAIDMANTELEIGKKSDKWILFQNVQASPEWLGLLEKKLEHVNHGSNFKLFLSCELDSVLPSTLISSSKILIFENSPGIRSMMKVTEDAVHPKLATAVPVEKKYVYFLLCWFHSIVQDRSRFVPESFSKHYDFNDADFESAVGVIDTWFGLHANGRTNVAPEAIDWEVFRSLIGDIIYGGKVDVAADFEYLRQLCGVLFAAEAFESGFNLISNQLTAQSGAKLEPPEGTESAVLAKWIAGLPELEPPEWLGLRNEVEQLLRQRENAQVSRKVVEILS